MEEKQVNTISRRKFLAAGSLFVSGLLLKRNISFGNTNGSADKSALMFPHFQDTLHAFLWRNWDLVPIERLAKVLKATPEEVRSIGKSMGLTEVKSITDEQLRRSYITIIRCNWHLLPREQMLELLNWTDERLTFVLKEDDFLYHKLGDFKPLCQPVRYSAQNKTAPDISKWITKVLGEEFPNGIPRQEEPPFHFVKELSIFPKEKKATSRPVVSGFHPRFAYSYFSLFGDPLLEPEIDPLPDGYLARMVNSGLDGTWMHIVLSKLTPFPWDPAISEHWEMRLENLRKLVARTKKQGIRIYLYLNEPRNLPLSFFNKFPELKGITNGNQAALCTSHPEVQKYLLESIAKITETIPDLGGFFSITASENATNCWSHGRGANCPRCSTLGAAKVIAGLNTIYQKGIDQGIKNYEAKCGKAASETPPRLIIWDWGWFKTLVPEEIVPALPQKAALMSVSEWDLPIERGGIKNTIGEYSISAVGPGPRATRNWEIARNHGMETIAKIQAGNTWEIAAAPYIPAVENVARHAVNLRKSKVNGLMLSWTLGGYPSPNLEVVAAIGNDPSISSDEAMEIVARRRYGQAGNAVVQAWKQYSIAFSEFPFGRGLYTAPMQAGPSNLLWERPTGYAATMTGLPYDAVNSWAGQYPVKVFTNQLLKIANGFDQGLSRLKQQISGLKLSERESKDLERECNVAETISIHCHSVANQMDFVTLRDRLIAERNSKERLLIIEKIEQILRDEIILAKRMHELQCSDSRLGFEASNHYFYTPADLIEKVLNCRDLLDRWLIGMKTKI